MWQKSDGKIKLKDIAKELGVLDSQIRKWKNQDKWNDKIKGTLPKSKSNVTKRRGAPKGSKNALGNKGGPGGPIGNVKTVKHGAYQTLYVDLLSEEEKELYDKTSADTDIDQEIRLMRLKIARLLNREKTFFYDMFGKKHYKEISEEERETGIIACMEQLRKLIELKSKMNNDNSKLEFEKYKADIDMQLKREKLDLEKSKVTGDDEPDKDDGFINALKTESPDIWAGEKDDRDNQESS